MNLSPLNSNFINYYLRIFKKKEFIMKNNKKKKHTRTEEEARLRGERLVRLRISSQNKGIEEKFGRIHQNRRNNTSKIRQWKNHRKNI